MDTMDLGLLALASDDGSGGALAAMSAVMAGAGALAVTGYLGLTDCIVAWRDATEQDFIDAGMREPKYRAQERLESMMRLPSGYIPREPAEPLPEKYVVTATDTRENTTDTTIVDTVDLEAAVALALSADGEGNGLDGPTLDMYYRRAERAMGAVRWIP